MNRVLALVFGALSAAGLAGCTDATRPGGSGAGYSVPVEKPTFKVWYYADNGKLIQSWEAATNADAQWPNDRCEIKDESGKDHVLFGTIVVEQLSQQPDGPAPTHTVTLYNFEGAVIRTWRATRVDPIWKNNLVRFTDQETKHQFDVIGRVHIKPL